MKIIKKSLIGLLPAIFIFLICFNVVFAVDLPDVDLESTELKTIIENAVNWVIGILTLIAVIVIIIAGIMWMTAGGNEEKQTSARSLLISGLIGLGIALAAYAIITVVVDFF